MLSNRRFLAKGLYQVQSAWFANSKGPGDKNKPTDPNEMLELGNLGLRKTKRKEVSLETLEFAQEKLRAARSRFVLDKENYRIDISLLDQ